MVLLQHVHVTQRVHFHEQESLVLGYMYDLFCLKNILKLILKQYWKSGDLFLFLFYLFIFLIWFDLIWFDLIFWCTCFLSRVIKKNGVLVFIRMPIRVSICFKKSPSRNVIDWEYVNHPVIVSMLGSILLCRTAMFVGSWWL